jgi:putative modified peptide
MTDISKLSALFDKLGSDDDFRARLAADPASALKEFGVNVPPGLHTGPITLPSKQEVQAKKGLWLAGAQAEPTAMAMFFFLK